MARYDKAFLDELQGLGSLAVSRRFWFAALLSVVPTALVFKIDSGFLFLLYLVAVCLWTRSAKLGGLIGWFIAAQTVFMYYKYPVAGHFIEILLRAPARASSTVQSAERVWSNIPETSSGQLFLSLVYGIRVGIVGLGLGFLGQRFWRPRTEP